MNVIDTDARFVIDPVSGDIANNSLKETIARYSHNSEVFTFEIPRNIGHDPVECNLIEIHYLNINARNKTETSEGIYKVNDIHAENDESAIFTWTIDGSATVFAGTLSFSIHFKCIDSEGKCLYRFPIHTYSKITVKDAIDNSGVVMEDNQDIIAEWEARISALEQNGGGGSGGLPALIVEPNSDGEANYTYEQINEHVMNGGTVILSIDGLLCDFVGCDGFSAVFMHVGNDGNVRLYEVSESPYIGERTLNYASKTDIGDISAALDHIIEIQEELIGT